MNPDKRKLKVTIKLLTPLHVGGEPGEDANKSYVLYGGDKEAYYPGTAFKGKVKHYARQLQIDRCNLPRNSKRLTEDKVCECTVCRLFGRKGNSRGSLIFSDFHAVGKPVIDTRAGNSIDRFRRVAEDAKLFTTESAVVSELVGDITGSMDSSDVDLLENSIKLIQQIGGNTSRGLGWVEDIKVELVNMHGEHNTKPDDDDHKPDDDDHKSDDDFTSCVQVIVTPMSPLLIGTHTTQSNFRDTQCIIPGSVLRAAMARAICEQDGTDDPSKEGIPVFPEDSSFTISRKAFPELRFSALESSAQESGPYPITMRKCKFNKTHAWVDVLAMLLSDTDCKEEKCRICEKRLEKVDPYEDFKKPRNDYKWTITSTHSEMDSWRGTSKDEQLYTVRAILPDAIVFKGTIFDKNGRISMNELSSLSKSHLHVGAMTTKGFGDCKIKFSKLAETPDNDLPQRIEEFNKLIVGRNEVLVPITLMSDAIVDLQDPVECRDRNEQGTTDYSEYDYTNAYASLVEHFELERVITKPRIWRGFATDKKQVSPKKAKFLLPAGSVLVVKVNAPDEETIGRLRELEHNGIGNDTIDGYGAVRVAHENHIKYALKEDNRNE